MNTFCVQENVNPVFVKCFCNGRLQLELLPSFSASPGSRCVNQSQARSAWQHHSTLQQSEYGVREC